MRLIDDWRWVINCAWSMRLLILAAVLSGFEMILPLFMDRPPLPRATFAALCFAITVAAFIVRLIAQREQPSERGE